MLRHESSYEGRTIGYIHVHLYLHANSLTNNSFQVMGYERAMYFKKESAPLSLSYFGLGGSGSKGGGFGFSKTGPSAIDGPVRVAQTNTFYQPPWWNEVQDEYFASREAVSLCDYSR